MGVTITSWNVNSVKTLRQYHPWSAVKSFADILHQLKADIYCLQETKLARSKLEREFALPQGFDAFYAFCSTRKGYSGVATFVRTSAKIPPVAAFDGFVGFFAQYKDWEAPVSFEELQEFDAEGRTLITDHGLFVLFNVYCPNETSVERLPFKMKFYQTLESVVTYLTRDKRRSVIVAGDINACRAEIDHCDPQKSNKEYGISDFNQHPARVWLSKFVADDGTGKLVDLFRLRNPDMRNCYTCWNTLLNARPANYGTRIDYILVSKDLVTQIDRCSIDSGVMGSDHCPVTISVNLPTDWIPAVKANQLPLICTKYYPEFALKQRSIHSYFTQLKPKTGNDDQTGLITIDDSASDKSPEKTDNQGKKYNQPTVIDPLAPKCKHGEPGREFTVNKTGPNKGRKFYLCARPVGPGHDGHELTEYRCNFFKWKDTDEKNKIIQKRNDSNNQSVAASKKQRLDTS